MNNQTTHVRLAIETDCENILKLDHDIRLEELLVCIQADRVLVIEENRRFIGLLRYTLYADSIPLLTRLIISADCRMHGCGFKLLDWWERAMEERGYSHLMTASTDAMPADEFYSKMGYTHAGSIHFPDGSHDTVFLKSLS